MIEGERGRENGQKKKKLVLDPYSYTTQTKTKHTQKNTNSKIELRSKTYATM